MSVILVFDDRPDEEQAILSGLKVNLGSEVQVEGFRCHTSPDRGVSYETHIAKWLDDCFGVGGVGLIACDKELGCFREFPGLSATPISAVARQKGIPFCQYSRQSEGNAREMARFQALRQWDSGEITLDGLDVDSWVRQIASLHKGFEFIATGYGSEHNARSPAEALATILEHPEAESRIALYGSGDRGFLRDILPFYDTGNPDNVTDLHKRMPRVLGAWLFLSILRFPGLLVNQVAAASYLNIAVKDFECGKVQQLFDAARYSGPFAELGPWWWRSSLDEVLDEAEAEDGRQFAGKEGVTVEGCIDPETDKRAGYYCMLTQRPVSADDSRSGISWFPSGADLARMRKDKFDEITALVGMY